MRFEYSSFKKYAYKGVITSYSIHYTKLYEPTTGLHFADVKLLMEVIQSLVDKGNTAILIEHNLDVIKCADYIIDLGPDAGDKGGEIVAVGTPEEIVQNKNSVT